MQLPFGFVSLAIPKNSLIMLTRLKDLNVFKRKILRTELQGKIAPMEHRR